MAITARRTYEVLGPSIRLPGKSKASTTYYKGQLLVLDGDGLMSPPTDGAGQIPIGIYTGHNAEFDGTLTTPSSGTPEIEAIGPYIWVPFATAAQTDCGEIFYFADNETVTKAKGSKTWGVFCEAFKTGYVLLNLNRLVPAP